MATKNDKIILEKIYPLLASSMTKNTNKFKKVVNGFMQSRNKELFDVCPCDRIYFGAEDLNEFYKAIEVSPDVIKKHLSETYYFNMANFNPAAAKDEFTIAMICIIRYFYLKKMKKELEMACIYLSFSGKFSTFLAFIKVLKIIKCFFYNS